MTGEFEKVEAAAAFLRARGCAPRVLVVLGTGLGGLADELEDAVLVPYAEIPEFPRSTSPGHGGRLAFGRCAGVPVMVMEGRFHFYEGYSMGAITRPVRAARRLGARSVLLTCAVGGMNPHLRPGDLVAVEDHINLMGDSPLRGPNDERLGPRFPDMSAPYDADLLQRAEAAALEAGFRLPRAVLVAVPGPQLETRAEYRFLRGAGADVVGMSTVPECIAAVHMGMRVAAFGVVTDMCLPDALRPAVVEEILAVAGEAAPRLRRLILGVLPHA